MSSVLVVYPRLGIEIAREMRIAGQPVGEAICFMELAQKDTEKKCGLTGASD
jgi:hypothetical protein